MQLPEGTNSTLHKCAVRQIENNCTGSKRGRRCSHHQNSEKADDATEKCKCTARLDGKTVLITGGNTGIGRATAEEIAKRGARIILASRDIDKSTQVQEEIIAKTHNSNIDVRPLNLESLASVREFAREFLASEDRLDVLINNAATPGKGGQGQLTQDGNQVAMQVNHLGHFLLTNLLLDLMKSSAPSRIVIVSSEGHKYGNNLLNPTDLNDLPEPSLKGGFIIYCITKLCNMLMVKELSKQLEGTGVTVNGLHPGTVKTDIWNGMPKMMRLVASILTWPILMSASEGAQTSLHLAVSPQLETISGKYFANCTVAEKSKMADDEEIARIVWETSSRLVEERS